MKNRGKVEEQLGPIASNPMTSKQVPHSMKVLEAEMHQAMRRHAQTLDFHQPSTGKKK